MSQRSFQDDASASRIHYFVYFVAGDMYGGRGALGAHDGSGSDDAQQIADWVATHFHPRIGDGVTVCDRSA